MSKEPVFMYGPKDGALVPPPLWALTVIELVQDMKDGTNVVYYYELDENTKNYYYRGQIRD